MIVLGIETSTPVTSLALGDRDGVIASVTLSRARGHVEFVAPAILEMCERAGVSVNRLGAIAVGIGPGLFTGMRVGIATAKTLAQIGHIPLVGISGLDLLAYEVRFSPRLICPVIDAKRDEVFTAYYRAVPGGVERLNDYASVRPDALVADLSARGRECLLVGNGVGAYAEVFAPLERAQVVATGVQYPRAEHLVELAIDRVERETFVSPARLEPLYVRKSDAEIKWEDRGVTIERPLRVKVPKRALEGGRS